MGDTQPVVSQRHGENRVRAGVDDPQPDPLARLGGERLRIVAGASVEQIHRVGHITAVAHHPVAHPRATHPHSPAGVGVLPGGHQIGVDLVRGLTDAVSPIVEHDHPLGVVVTRLTRIIDDERRVQAAVQLQARMGMEPVGSRVRDHEVEIERAPGIDGRGGDPGHAVHVISDRQPMPMDTGRLGKVITDCYLDPVTGRCSQRFAGHGVAVGPRGRDPSPEVDVHGSRIQRHRPHGPGRGSSGLSGRDLGLAGEAAGAGAGRHTQRGTDSRHAHQELAPGQGLLTDHTVMLGHQPRGSTQNL